MNIHMAKRRCVLVGASIAVSGWFASLSSDPDSAIVTAPTVAVGLLLVWIGIRDTVEVP